MSERDRREVQAGDLLTSGPEPSGGRSPWVWRIVGVLAVCVAAATVGPGLLSGPDAAPPHAAASPAAASPAPISSGDQPLGPPELHNNPLRGWTSRGAELGTPFVDAALARMSAEGRHVDRVLWAGSLDGHDHVVVVSYRMAPVQRASDDLEIGALRVQRESQLATAHSVTVGYVGRPEDLVAMAWHVDDNHTRLLVLSYPEERRVQISSAVDYHPSGEVSRRWQAAALGDGFLVTDLGRDVDAMFVVRPAELSSLTNPVLVGVAGLRPQPGARELTVAGAHAPSYAGPAIGVLAESLGETMRPFCDLRDTDVRVLWSGRIETGRRASGTPVRTRAALLVVRRRDGATFQAFVYARAHDLRGVSTANPVRWSVADRLPYAVSLTGHFLLVSPGGPGSATVRPVVGHRLRVQLNGNGVARVDSPYSDGAKVVVRDPSGHTVLRTALVNTITANIFGLGL